MVLSKSGEMADSLPLDFAWLPWVENLALQLRLGGPADDKAFPFSYVQFLAAFMDACQNLHLTAVVPYQWRHSGESLDVARRSRSLAEVQKRGRWKSHKSVMRYEKSGRMSLALQDLPRTLVDHAFACEARLEDIVFRGFTI